eukprot:1192119-Prorocentrum_minimum.AAC.2
MQVVPAGGVAGGPAHPRWDPAKVTKGFRVLRVSPRCQLVTSGWCDRMCTTGRPRGYLKKTRLPDADAPSVTFDNIWPV